MEPYCRPPASQPLFDFLSGTGKRRDLLVFPRQIFWFALIVELVFTIVIGNAALAVRGKLQASLIAAGLWINVNDRFGKWNERITGATAEKATRTQGCV